MIVMTVDTCSVEASVGIVRDGHVLAEAWNREQVRHAERLGGMARDVLGRAGVSLGEVQLLVSGKGPGSFTGVRVGMAFAKGLALAARIPLVGVESLEAMAWSARQQRRDEAVVAVLDARKQELFVACYGADGEVLAAPDHVGREKVAAWVARLGLRQGGWCVVGQRFDEVRLPGVEWLSGDGFRVPTPRAMAALGEDKWRKQSVDEIELLEPLYVRPPDITKPRNSPPA